jgi:hypothetical protein
VVLFIRKNIFLYFLFLSLSLLCLSHSFTFFFSLLLSPTRLSHSCCVFCSTSLFSSQEILRVAEEFHLPIVSDEIYGNLVFPGAQFFPLATLTSTVPILTVRCTQSTLLSFLLLFVLVWLCDSVMDDMWILRCGVVGEWSGQRICCSRLASGLDSHS